MSSQPMDRRVNRLENEVESIYDMFAQIQIVTTRHDGRLREIQSHLFGVDETLRVHGGRLDGIDGRLDGIDGRLGGIDGRLGGIDGRLGGIDGRLDGIDDRLTEVLEILRAG